MLGVGPDADQGAIRAAYRDLARRWHPDRRAADASTEPGQMPAINEAYRVLSDPGRRAAYDRSLGDRRARPAAESALDPDADPDLDLQPPTPQRHSVLSPAGPARVPWRLMAAAAALGSAVVLVSSLFDEPPGTQAPDGIIQPGSCVEFETNGDAREVACTGERDIVVESLVPLDGTCPGSTVGHRDRLGLGIACVAST